MEMYEGYKVGTTPGTDVVGANENSLNRRMPYALLRTTREAWSNGDEPRLPSGAALYVTRNPITPNFSTPNAIPSDAAAGLFLAPQAEVPVTGNTWGLLLKYNCTEAHRLDQFTILNRRINSSNPAFVKGDVYKNSDENLHYFYTLDDGSSISALGQYVQLGNLNGFIEVGTSTGFLNLIKMVRAWGYGPPYLAKVDSQVYAGLDEEEVFELALWNNFVDYSLPPHPPRVKNPISELENEHLTPFSKKDAWEHSPWDGTFSAVGVRCVSFSVSGTAKVNGLRGTFEDFQRKDAFIISWNPVPRFSLGIPLMLLGLVEESFKILVGKGVVHPDSYNEHHKPFGNHSVSYLQLNSTYEFLLALAGATHLRYNTSTGDQLARDFVAPFQSEDLQRAIVAAYRQYAAQLMYFDVSHPDSAWKSRNLTAAVSWTWMRKGSGVPPLLVLIMMWIWALACAGLSVLYGFGRRWEETVNYQYIQNFQETKVEEEPPKQPIKPKDPEGLVPTHDEQGSSSLIRAVLGQVERARSGLA